MKACLIRALLPLVLVAGLPAASADETQWIADQNGCRIANTYPQDGETVRWSGGCKEGYADGAGTLTWFIKGRKTDVYEGSMVRGWAEGRGKLTRKDGVYTGEWKKSLQHGRGRYEHQDGSWYEGGWKDGQPHGHGQMRTPDGRMFSGTWHDGQFEDEGPAGNRA